MAYQTIEVPGVGDVDFPDTMSDEEIAAAIRKNILKEEEPPKVEPPKPAPPPSYTGQRFDVAGGSTPSVPAPIPSKPSGFLTKKEPGVTAPVGTSDILVPPPMTSISQDESEVQTFGDIEKTATKAVAKKKAMEKIGVETDERKRIEQAQTATEEAIGKTIEDRMTTTPEKMAEKDVGRKRPEYFPGTNTVMEVYKLATEPLQRIFEAAAHGKSFKETLGERYLATQNLLKNAEEMDRLRLRKDRGEALSKEEQAKVDVEPHFWETVGSMVQAVSNDPVAFGYELLTQVGKDLPLMVGGVGLARAGVKGGIRATEVATTIARTRKAKNMLTEAAETALKAGEEAKAVKKVQDMSATLERLKSMWETRKAVATTKEALAGPHAGKAIAKEAVEEIGGNVAVGVPLENQRGAKYGVEAGGQDAAIGALFMLPGISKLRAGRAITSGEFEQIGRVVRRAGLENHPKIQEFLPKFKELAKNTEFQGMFDVTTQKKAISREQAIKSYDQPGHDQGYIDRQFPGEQEFEVAGETGIHKIGRAEQAQGKIQKGEVRLYNRAGGSDVVEESAHLAEDAINDDALKSKIKAWKLEKRALAKEQGVELPSDLEMFAQAFAAKQHPEAYPEAIRNLDIPKDLYDEFNSSLGYGGEKPRPKAEPQTPPVAETVPRETPPVEAAPKPEPPPEVETEPKFLKQVFEEEAAKRRMNLNDPEHVATLQEALGSKFGHLLGGRKYMKDRENPAIGDWFVKMDVARFKEDINDKFGEGAGDQFLAEMSKEVGKASDAAQSRGYGYGGDEFGGIAKSQAQAEQIGKSIQDLFLSGGMEFFDASGKNIGKVDRVIVDYGIGTHTEGKRGYENADTELKLAKERGRNLPPEHPLYRGESRKSTPSRIPEGPGGALPGTASVLLPDEGVGRGQNGNDVAGAQADRNLAGLDKPPEGWLPSLHKFARAKEYLKTVIKKGELTDQGVSRFVYSLGNDPVPEIPKRKSPGSIAARAERTREIQYTNQFLDIGDEGLETKQVKASELPDKFDIAGVNLRRVKTKDADVIKYKDEKGGEYVFKPDQMVHTGSLDKVPFSLKPVEEAGIPKGKESDADELAKAAKLWKEKGTESPYFKEWFGESTVLNDKGEPLVVYHGSGNKSGIMDGGFSHKFTDKGNDQFGSGFYFTNKKQTAKGYSRSRISSDVEKIGGESSPGIVDAYLTIKRPIITSEKNPKPNINLNEAQVRRLIRQAPDIRDPDGPLSNWGDVRSEGYEKVLSDAVENYVGNESIFPLANDFYHGKAEEFLRNLKSATGPFVGKPSGYDGWIHEFPNGEKHYVAWFPEQIKSATGNRGTFSKESPNIAYSLKPLSKTEESSREAISKHLTAKAGMDEIRKDPDVRKLFDAAGKAEPTSALPGYGSDKFNAFRKFNVLDDNGKITGTITGREKYIKHAIKKADSYSGGEVAKDRKATIVIGLPASGKSRISEALARERKSAIVDVDDVAKGIPEYGDGSGRTAVHDEASAINDEVVGRQVESGKNFIIPKIGESPHSLGPLVDRLKNQGYTTDIVFIKTEKNEAFRRMLRRYLGNNRLVKESVYDNVDKIQKTYDDIKGKDGVNEYTEIDNNHRTPSIISGQGTTIASDLLRGQSGDGAGGKRVNDENVRPDGSQTAGREGLATPASQAAYSLKPSEPSDKNAPAFFSHLRKTIDQKMPNAAPPDQIRGILKGAGVKEEEMKWSDIDGLLEGKTKVSKADVIKHLEENQVQVQEVVKGGSQADVQRTEDALIEQAKKEGIGEPRYYALAVARNELRADLMSKEMKPLAEKLRQAYEKRLKEGDTPQTKFSSYQLPGGDNYRELLLTLPKRLSIYGEWTQKQWEPFSGKMFAKYGEGWAAKANRNKLTENELTQLNKLESEEPRGGATEASRNFKSTHFDEPNILAHIRFNDRIAINNDVAPYERGGKVSASDGESGPGIYAYEGGNKAMRDYYTKNGEDRTLIYPKSGAKVIDLTTAESTKGIIAEAKNMNGGKTTATSSTIQKHPWAIRAYIGKIQADAYLVKHSGPGIPTGKQLVITNESAFEFRPEKQRVLFLEEVQSDAHQLGRKHGYQGDIEKRVEDLKVEIEKKYGKSLIELRDVRRKNSRPPEVEKDLEALDKLAFDARTEFHGNKVPDLPFKKTWHELALRRMLRYASENGYDRLAWTTGEQQAARYDLSKQVDEIAVTREKGQNTFDVGAAKNGKSIFTRDGLSPSQLEETIGKDLAAKAVSDANKLSGAAWSAQYKGDDLKVGGEGMKTFYDKMIPQYLDKYGKKWGAKVEPAEINTVKDYESPTFPRGNQVQKYDPVQSIPVTDAMRKSVVEEGQPLFSLKPSMVERKVESLRKAESNQGAFRSELLRDKEETWASLEDNTRKIAETWDIENFSKTAGERQLTPAEVMAAGARIKDAEVREIDALTEAAAARASGDKKAGDIADAKAVAAQMEKLVLLNAAINNGTVSARALAVHRKFMDAIGKNADTVFILKAIRELGVKDAEALKLLRIFKDDPRNFGAAIHTYLKFSSVDKVMEYWKAGLLSGAPTHVANTVGNVVEAGLMNAETFASGAIDKVLGLFDKNGGRQRYMSEGVYETAGLTQGFAPAAGNFLKSLGPIFALQGKLFNLENKFDRQAGAIAGKKGELIRIPFKLLEAEDQFFKSMGKQADLYKLAHRKAKKEGLTGDALRKREGEIISEFLNSPDKHRDLAQELYSQGKVRTYQENAGEGKKYAPFSHLAQVIGQGKTSESSAVKLGANIVFPFSKTPANIFDRAIERSPLGYAYSAGLAKDWQKALTEAETKAKIADQNPGNIGHQKAAAAAREAAGRLRGQLSDQLARASVGTVALTGIGLLASQGIITGSGPKDRAKRELLEKELGWQPYSVKINGKYYPLQRIMGAMGPSIGAVADIFEYAKDGDEGATSKAMSAALKNLTDQSYLQGLIEFTSAVNDPARYAKTYGMNLLTSLVPASSLVRSAARATDKTQRDLKGEGFIDELKTRLKASIPYLSRTLPEKYGVTGNIQERKGTAAERLLSPAPVSSENVEKTVEKELLTLDYRIPKLERGIKTNLSPESKAEEYPLNEEEFQILLNARKEATAELKAEIESDGWKNMDLDERSKTARDIYQGILDGAREEVKDMIRARKGI